VKLATRVVEHLESRGVPCALVGGVALGAHGIARATLDIDVLVASPAVLEPAFWATLKGGPTAEIRKGDAHDPLLGMVRLPDPHEPVDVIVGRGAWMERPLERHITIEIEGALLPFVDRADLVILKLYSGGPQDLLDAELLLATDPEAVRQAVNARLAGVPAAVCDLWRSISNS
jgi:hypothetical protein